MEEEPGVHIKSIGKKDGSSHETTQEIRELTKN